MAETARIADDGGVASFTVMDHYFQMEQAGSADQPMLEAYTTLGYVAAVTRRMTLGVLVTGVMYRYPGLLAKIVTTLDVLSGGRGRLGIGASWYEREQRALGVPVVPVPERFERLEETLQICLQMWSDNDGPYQGRHYRLAETLCSPRPLTRPHPPILVGGGGEKRTLLLVARYADACNLFATSPADVAHKLDVLRRHCDDEGRDYDSITKTALYVGPAGARQHRPVPRRRRAVRQARHQRAGGHARPKPRRLRNRTGRTGHTATQRHRLIPHTGNLTRPSVCSPPAVVVTRTLPAAGESCASRGDGVERSAAFVITCGWGRRTVQPCVSTGSSGSRLGPPFLEPRHRAPRTLSREEGVAGAHVGVVVVGVDASEVAKAALVFAAGEADRRGKFSAAITSRRSRPSRSPM